MCAATVATREPQQGGRTAQTTGEATGDWGKAKRRRKQKWRATQGLRLPNVCMNCGQPGPHFIPPGFGSPGMFMCKAAVPVSTTTEGKAER